MGGVDVVNANASGQGGQSLADKLFPPEGADVEQNRETGEIQLGSGSAGKVSGLGEEMKAIRAIDGWLEKFDRPGAERVIRFVLEHRGGQVTFGNR